MAVPNTQQPRSCLLGGAVLLAFSAVAGHAYEAATHAGDVRVISDIVGCGTKPIGQIIVATLNRAPMVSLFANGHAISLILDTGAERTILTPAVADRIGAQRPRVEFQRQMRGIAGTLPTHEVELRSFAAGNIAMPWRRVFVAPVTLTK